jgi:hypothetical protein
MGLPTMPDPSTTPAASRRSSSVPGAPANAHAKAAVEQAFLAILRARQPALTWTLLRNEPSATRRNRPPRQ